jgi:hypothetical protein
MIDPRSFARSPRFPATGFRSYDEFQSFQRDNRGQLDSRYEYELSLATRDPKIVSLGTCALCLRPAQFLSATVSAEKTSDGRRLPNWREEMRCDCKDRLISRRRALCHFLQSSGLLPWMHLLIFGTPGDADHRLAAMAAHAILVSRLRSPDSKSVHAPLPYLRLSRAIAHLAVSEDYIQFIPPVSIALAEICGALVSGGRFIFTVPFHYDQPKTVLMPEDAMAFATEAPLEFRGQTHKFGWDILDTLKQAGFKDAVAYLYWSEELGYLGSMNFIFRAIK